MSSTIQSLPGILARWADTTARTAQLTAWRDDAITKAAENQGAQIRNASAHGISFALAGGLTWDQWLLVVDAALRINERNVQGTSRAVATFRSV